MEPKISDTRIMAEAMEIAISAATKFLTAQGCNQPTGTLDHIFDHDRILGHVSGQISLKFKTRTEDEANREGGISRQAETAD